MIFFFFLSDVFSDVKVVRIGREKIDDSASVFSFLSWKVFYSFFCRSCFFFLFEGRLAVIG